MSLRLGAMDRVRAKAVRGDRNRNRENCAVQPGTLKAASVTPSKTTEHCMDGNEFSAPPGNCRTVSAQPEALASLSANGMNNALFIWYFGPMR